MCESFLFFGVSGDGGGLSILFFFLSLSFRVRLGGMDRNSVSLRGG